MVNKSGMYMREKREGKEREKEWLTRCKFKAVLA